MKLGEDDIPAWYCLRTQLKREKMAALNLRSIEGVEVFLPRLRYKKSTRRGVIWWVEPMFPGYLLAKFRPLEQSRQVAATGGVSHLIKFGDELPEVPESFVETLRAELIRHQAEDEELVVERILKVGDEVEIATGAFQGMEGRIVEVRPGVERVGLLLEFLGEERPVTVSLFDLILDRAPAPADFKQSGNSSEK